MLAISCENKVDKLSRAVASGRALAPQFLVDQLTLSQLKDYAHLSTTSYPGFSDPATALSFKLHIPICI